MNLDLARLNHILIPPTKEGRDRLRRSRLGRAMRPISALLAAATPEGRLLLLLTLFAGVFGLDARRTQVHILFGLLAAVMASSIAVSRRFRMAHVRLDATAPPRVTAGEELTFTLSCANRGAQTIRAVRVDGPFLPYDGKWMNGRPFFSEVAPGKTVAAQVRATFARRGLHHLDPFGAAAMVPLGLAQGPPVESGGLRFVVVPRLAAVGRLRLPLGRRHHPGGVPLASRTGDSLEFSGVRPYRPGDPVRDLHVRTWARLGSPMVRERQQEYFSRVGVVLDTDAGVAPPRLLEAAISLAGGLVAHLSRGEALIDLLVVGEHLHELTLGRSLGHLEQALDLLACVEPGPAFAPEQLQARITPHLPRLSSLVLVALSWDDTRRRFAEGVRATGVGCRVLRVVEERSEHAQAAGHDVQPLEVTAQAIERREALHL